LQKKWGPGWRERRAVKEEREQERGERMEGGEVLGGKQ